jgi:hypothetical protein
MALVGETICIGKQDKHPNDASFGGKEVNISFVKGPNDSAYMGQSVSVSSSPKANDSGLMGKTISMKSSGIRPNDSSVTGDSVRLSRTSHKTKERINGDMKMSARVPAPKDDMLTRAERRMSKTQEDAKEPERESPYKKGSIASGYEKKSEPEDDDTDDDLFWIK